MHPEKRGVRNYSLHAFVLAVLGFSLGCGDALEFVESQGLVRGTLIDNFGQPVAGASVRSVTGGDEETARTTTTGADGSYTVGCAKGLVTVSFSSPTVLPGSLTINSPGTEVVTAPGALLVARPPADGIWVGAKGKYEAVPWVATTTSSRQIPRGGVCSDIVPGGAVSAGDKQFYLFLQGKEAAHFALVALPKNILWSTGGCPDRATSAMGVTSRSVPGGEVLHGGLASGSYCMIETENDVYSQRNMGRAACFYWRGDAPVVTGEAG